MAERAMLTGGVGRLFLFVFSLVACAPDVHSEQRTETVKLCAEALNEKSVRACTDLIESGEYHGRSLGGAYGFRGLARDRLSLFNEAIGDYNLALEANGPAPNIFALRAG